MSKRKKGPEVTGKTGQDQRQVGTSCNWIVYVVLICLWLKEKIWNNINPKNPRYSYPPKTTNNQNGWDKGGSDQEDGGPVNQKPCNKKPCLIIAGHRHKNVRNRGYAGETARATTLKNWRRKDVDKASSSRRPRPRPHRVCIYKAIANPQGQKKGKGKEKGARVLEKDFLLKLEKVHQNLKVREREREKEDKKLNLEGGERERDRKSGGKFWKGGRRPPTKRPPTQRPPT